MNERGAARRDATRRAAETPPSANIHEGSRHVQDTTNSAVPAELRTNTRESRHMHRWRGRPRAGALIGDFLAFALVIGSVAVATLVLFELLRLVLS